MGQLDRDWYKDHHQQKTTKHQTLDKDPRELEQPTPSQNRISIIHVLVFFVGLTYLIYFLFSK